MPYRSTQPNIRQRMPNVNRIYDRWNIRQITEDNIYDTSDTKKEEVTATTNERKNWDMGIGETDITQS